MSRRTDEEAEKDAHDCGGARVQTSHDLIVELDGKVRHRDAVIKDQENALYWLGRIVAARDEHIRGLQAELHDTEVRFQAWRAEAERVRRGWANARDERRLLTEQLAEARSKAGDYVSRKHYREVNEATEAQISRLVQERSSLKTRLFYSERFVERLKGYLKAVTQERNEARKAYREATKSIDPVALTASARRIKELEERSAIAMQVYSGCNERAKLLRQQIADLTRERDDARTALQEVLREFAIR